MTFDEGLSPKCRSHLYSAVLEFFLCYSIYLLCSNFVFLLFILVEIATLTRENGVTKFHILTSAEVESLIKAHEAEEKEKESSKTSKK